MTITILDELLALHDLPTEQREMEARLSDQEGDTSGSEEYNAAVVCDPLAAKMPHIPKVPLAAAGFQGYRYRKG